jgi:hypothetical protein
VNIPIGQNGEDTLACFIDTGAGVNLGRAKYHPNIRSQNPGVVKSFQRITDWHPLHNLELRGIDAQVPNRLRAIEIIEYHTPYEINGHPMTIPIILTHAAAADTIIGTPTLRRARSTMFLDDNGHTTLILLRAYRALTITYQEPGGTNYEPQDQEEA